MSGIAGVYRLNGMPLHDEVARMAADPAMRRRGPDGSGLWVEGPVGLGQRMARTAAGSRLEILPFTAPGGMRTVTADARLDNRDELLDKLAPGRRSPGEVGDGELILRAFQRWGRACVTCLLGDFAFVLWDGSTRALFAARDPFGVKPLYYHHRPGRLFAFASEEGALLALDDLRGAVNPARIADFLVPGLEAVDSVSTSYEEILRLPPAHMLTVGPEGFRLDRYWQPRAHASSSGLSGDEAVEAFLGRFREAVACRLAGAKRPGSMLSGGLDSSAIVGTARAILEDDEGRALPVFAALAGEPAGCAETRSAEKVLGLSGLEAHRVRCDALGPFLDGIERFNREADELFDVPMVLPWVIYAMAGAAGADVVLDGVDGDMVVSLEPDCLASLLRSGRGLAAARLAVEFARFYRGWYEPWASAPGLFARAARRAFTPGFARSWWRARGRPARERAAVRGTILDLGFAREIDLVERLDALAAHAGERPAADPAEHHARAVSHPNLVVALERYDRLASRHGVEPRHPFLDRRLVELCLALPWEQKVRDGWPKAVLRRAMKGLLPDEVRWRPRRWERHGPAFAEAYLRSRAPRLREAVEGSRDVGNYVDLAAVRVAGERFGTLGTLEDGEKLWQAASLAWWLERAGEVASGSRDSDLRLPAAGHGPV